MNATLRTMAGALGLAGLIGLAACERPPMETTQLGYRGTGMEQVTNPRIAAAQPVVQIPEALPAADASGPKASEVYQNVQVLGDLSVGEFTRLMLAITAWVSPEQGCLYCHVGDNLADDSMYTKVVSRRMLQMTQHINSEWKTHVAETGVTCFTCHRGQPVPENIWFAPLEPVQNARAAGNDGGQNKPSPMVALSSLPYDPLTPYLSQNNPIRIEGTTALPTGNKTSIQSTEQTYGLMMHMSDSLGVNCTFCHNSQNFSSWEHSPPQRATAWHGIQMARDVNNAYIEPLLPVFPTERLGPTGDVAKVSCATCHAGANKPLGGMSMLKDHPELAGPMGAKSVKALEEALAAVRAESITGAPVAR